MLPRHPADRQTDITSAMPGAQASETETVGDPTLAQKTGSYREPVLGLLFGTHGWATSWPLVPPARAFQLHLAAVLAQCAGTA